MPWVPCGPVGPWGPGGPCTPVEPFGHAANESSDTSRNRRVGRAPPNKTEGSGLYTARNPAHPAFFRQGRPFPLVIGAADDGHRVRARRSRALGIRETPGGPLARIREDALVADDAGAAGDAVPLKTIHLDFWVLGS